jgi:hypothetical protein
MRIGRRADVDNVRFHTLEELVETRETIGLRAQLLHVLRRCIRWIGETDHDGRRIRTFDGLRVLPCHATGACQGDPQRAFIRSIHHQT